MNLELALSADGDDAEVDVLRFDGEFRGAERVAGQFIEKLIEAAIMIGEFGRFLCRHDKINAPTARGSWRDNPALVVTGGSHSSVQASASSLKLRQARPVGKTKGLANS